jgi:hypothetical protein
MPRIAKDNKLTDETEAPWTGPKWKDASQALAALGRERLLGPGVVLVATIRPDGTPRLSPVEPFIMDGTLSRGKPGRPGEPDQRKPCQRPWPLTCSLSLAT